MGGVCRAIPEVVSWGSGRLDVFVIGKFLPHSSIRTSLRRIHVAYLLEPSPGTDSAVYHKWYDGSSWGPSLTGYERMGGIVIRDITGVCWGPNRIDLFVIGTAGDIFQKYWSPSTGWKPALTDYYELGGVSYSAVATNS
jgi:hypothetical protein